MRLNVRFIMNNRILGASQGPVDSQRGRHIQKDLNRAFETLKEGNYVLVRSNTERTLLNKEQVYTPCKRPWKRQPGE